MTAIGHPWRPIEAPPDPAALAEARTSIYINAWRRKRTELASQIELTTRFEDELRRRWAIETGIIERLYDISRGTTKVLIERGFVASLIAHGESSLPPERLVTILNDHLQGLDMVMDVVGGARPLSTSWIKELHALMTRGQGMVEARASDGRVFEVPLLRGEWKRLPNSPTRPSGEIHQYCPPEHTAAEMDRLLSLYEQIPRDLPDVRAAWLHHAFTQIHPFQDGNGRVARALASIDLIRAGLFPVVIDRDQKLDYVQALEVADSGNLRPLVKLFNDNVERDMLRALGVAEKLLSTDRGIDSVIQAAANKLSARKTVGRSTLENATARLAVLNQSSLGRLLATVPKFEGVPRVRAGASISRPETEHYYRHQITEFGKRGDYWVDLREPRFWSQLSIKDGGDTKIVIVLHFIGNPTRGDAIANVFMDHRDYREQTSADSDRALIELPVRPLLLPAGEPADAQQGRFFEWHEGALEAGLAQWLNYI